MQAERAIVRKNEIFDGRYLPNNNLSTPSMMREEKIRLYSEQNCDCANMHHYYKYNL